MRKFTAVPGKGIFASEGAKRDIMELPTSERLRVISDMLDRYPSGISTEAAMKYLEDHGWDTSNYPTEQFDSDWDDYAKYYDEDEYDEDEDDGNIDWIETRADALRWLNDMQKKYGSTYFFPPDARYKLDKLVEKFGNTYFWK